MRGRLEVSSKKAHDVSLLAGSDGSLDMVFRFLTGRGSRKAPLQPKLILSCHLFGAAALVFLIVISYPMIAQAAGPKAQETLRKLDRELTEAQRSRDDGKSFDLARKLVAFARQAFGDRDPTTLTVLSNVGMFYYSRGRFDEAEALWLEGLQVSRRLNGPKHSNTLSYLNYLGVLYLKNQNYKKAAPLMQEALTISQETLGPTDENTLKHLHNLGVLFLRSREFSKAADVFEQSIKASREVLGPRHPETVFRLLDLEQAYLGQNRCSDAGRVVREALDLSGPGPEMPLVQLDIATSLIRERQHLGALCVLLRLDLDSLIPEEQDAGKLPVRRKFWELQRTFQNIALNLASQLNNSDTRQLAGNLMTRFKLLQGEEDVYLARVARNTSDPKVKLLVDEIKGLRTTVLSAEDPSDHLHAFRQLHTKQLELSAAAQAYRNRRRELSMTVDDLRHGLPENAALIIFRRFIPLTPEDRAAKPHFAALLLTASSEPVLVDVGSIEVPREDIDDETATILFKRLFGSFDQVLAAAATVYIAPDGVLNRTPFARLRLPDGRFWVERQQVRVLQSASSLLNISLDRPFARGLLALGDIDFGPVAANRTTPARTLQIYKDSLDAIVAEEGVRPANFRKLVQSGDEALDIKEVHELLRKDEPAEVWLGADASKARLFALKTPPRILHLATHGFYFPFGQEPMLDSGVALAGANRDLDGKSSGGILFALEAQELNLEGTDLVALSACETGHGSLDYSEGVYGLARAFHIAGAQNVLVALWSVNDGEARDFMRTFYKIWLSQEHGDPATALRAAQMAFIMDETKRDPRIWAPYVIIE
jgi:CHAT domain-containing protein/tetratricopeptide (TPR) repeat protein